MAASSNWSARLARRSASSRACQKAGSASRTPVGAASCSVAKRFSPDSQRMSSCCSPQWRNRSDSCVAASASTLRSAVQSKTHGSGICSVCERSRATASMSSSSGQTQPTSPPAHAAAALGTGRVCHRVGDQLGQREPLRRRPAELLRVVERQALELVLLAGGAVQVEQHQPGLGMLRAGAARAGEPATAPARTGRSRHWRRRSPPRRVRGRAPPR